MVYPTSMRLASPVVLLVGLLIAVPAHPAPVVTVKVRTAIELDPVRREAGGITVRGRVVDRFSREPVRWLRVTVHLDDFVRIAQSDSEGRFEASFSAVDGTHQLEVTYPGDRNYAPASYQISDFDVAKNPLTLSITTEPVVDYGAGGLEVNLHAGSDIGGVAIHAELRFGDAEAESLAPIGSATTDQFGRGSIVLDQKTLGSPGRKRIEVRFAGSPDYDAARAHTTFLVVTGSAIEFALRDTQIAYESRLRGKGRVTDDAGDPIAGAPVALVIGDRHLAETLAGADGGFSFRVRGSDLGPGKHNVQAVFEPSRSWHRGSRSAPATVLVAEPKPIPVSYTLAAFAVTALALVAFVGLRTQPWRRWQWLARWRKAKPEPAHEPGGDRPAAAIRTGLVPSRPSLVSTLRRAHDSGFTGVVRNAINGRPLAGATVTLDHVQNPQRVLDTATSGAARGSFGFEKLGPGPWRASVSATGYVTEQFAITVPHRGELRGVRIDLLPVRERIFQMYGDVAVPLLPDPELWCIWTPRQVLDHVRQVMLTARVEQASPLVALTDFVEETYFSRRRPEESVLPTAADMVAAASTATTGLTAPREPEPPPT